MLCVLAHASINYACGIVFPHTLRPLSLGGKQRKRYEVDASLRGKGKHPTNFVFSSIRPLYIRPSAPYNILYPVVAEGSEGRWKGIVGGVVVFQKYLLKIS